jgi:hypothetical protein
MSGLNGKFKCRSRERNHKVDHSNAKVGGTHKMSFTNFTTGRSHSFGGEYRETIGADQIYCSCEVTQLVHQYPWPALAGLQHLGTASYQTL